MKKKIVLAYSGGLDTSYCIKYLTAEAGYEVHALTVDTGGFADDEIQEMEARALSLGAASYRREDVTESYYRECLRYLVYGNCLRYQTYPMSVSAERMFQAMSVARYAVAIDADGVAHGSTGAGNDQVRFDLAFELSGKTLEIITPIRDMQLSRQQEVDYLAQHGLVWPEKKGKYSINAGLWGTSVGGTETLTSHQNLPESAWPVPVTATGPREIDLHFAAGEFTGFDDQKFSSPVAAIKALEALAAPYGIGRDIHVGDTIIGIKGRVGFAAAAAMLIIKSHHLLEKHTLGKWQLFWKEQLANWYGMMLHEGQFLDPVMRDVEAFLESSQGTVNGTVHVTLHPHRFVLNGITSPNDLLGAGFGAYGEANEGWSGDDVRGFTKILSVPGRIRNSVNQQP
ncbi:argininosuccinate synthase [Neolewinella lacunae]|uniref:argininosuccinate synthase n=1 Tax=Neolewinella lacunae TaxID=1517758 RepID=A0A923PHJ7_9BACT|nr:argininosuccinate synthase domain-containing protein [Neolewinella lacunae]MBC6994200.1 argininosuccinate synthase [Neolewinella lacunae]MDN3634641.1 argininosuccinate synthase [Neolewinella lacunae]